MKLLPESLQLAQVLLYNIFLHCFTTLDWHESYSADILAKLSLPKTAVSRLSIQSYWLKSIFSYTETCRDEILNLLIITQSLSGIIYLYVEVICNLCVPSTCIPCQQKMWSSGEVSWSFCRFTEIRDINFLRQFCTTWWWSWNDFHVFPMNHRGKVASNIYKAT